MGDKGSTQVGARLPGHIYRWLKKKIDNSDYPNMSQAVIGELTKAKLNEEKGDYTAPDRPESVHEPAPNYEALIRKQMNALRKELKEEILKELEEQRG